jgi:DNA repair ATPase RecN
VLVNISYSIDFEEVPKVVRKFLQEDIQKEFGTGVLHKLEDSIVYLEDGRENIGKAVQSIEEIRKFLIKVDMRLNECSGILKGYQQELLNEVQAAPSPENTDLSDIQEDLSTLRKRLEEGGDEIENR